MAVRAIEAALGRRLKLAEREAIDGYICVSPWVIGFLIFILGMMVFSLYTSFTEYDIIKPAKWIGFGNYEKMFFRDDLFWWSWSRTAIYSIITVPLGVVIAYALAVLLNQKVLGLSFWRTLFYMPVVVPAVAAAYIFGWLFAPEVGLINGFLKLAGMAGPAQMVRFAAVGAAWDGNSDHLGGRRWPHTVPRGPPISADRAIRCRQSRWRQRLDSLLVHHHSNDLAGRAVHDHHWDYQFLPSVHRRLLANRGWAGQRDDVHSALSLSKRMARVPDGIRVRPRLGFVCRHHGVDRSSVVHQ